MGAFYLSNRSRACSAKDYRCHGSYPALLTKPSTAVRYQIRQKLHAVTTEDEEETLWLRISLLTNQRSALLEDVVKDTASADGQWRSMSEMESVQTDYSGGQRYVRRLSSFLPRNKVHPGPRKCVATLSVKDLLRNQSVLDLG